MSKVKASCYWCRHARTWDDPGDRIIPPDEGYECGALIDKDTWRSRETAIAHVYDAYEEDYPDHELDELYAGHCPGYLPEIWQGHCACCNKKMSLDVNRHKWWANDWQSGEPYPVCSKDCLQSQESRERVQGEYWLEVEDAWAREQNHRGIQCIACNQFFKTQAGQFKHWVKNLVANTQYPVCSTQCQVNRIKVENTNFNRWLNKERQEMAEVQLLAERTRADRLYGDY